MGLHRSSLDHGRKRQLLEPSFPPAQQATFTLAYRERSEEESLYLPWTSCPEEDGKNKREAWSSSPPRC